MIVKSSKGFIDILAKTCRYVVFVIPMLIRLGLIDRLGCVVVGVAIGIVVAVTSIHASQVSSATTRTHA